ncbi:MAG: sulfotransferase [Candidatus Marinimicrobia bacterium]|nr:sulfotransferase [Candidatus Neomarinimicrobiota bacterium]
MPAAPFSPPSILPSRQLYIQPLRNAFIVGVARSGSSILGELIAAHPQVDYLFEVHQIWEVGGAGINASHRLTAEHATPQVAKAIQTWFAERQTPDRLLLEKNPRNVLRIPYLRAIFPEARIIHLVRDGRDAACSMVPGCGGEKWLHLKPPSWNTFFSEYSGAVRCAHAWQEAAEIALADLASVFHLLLRYESLLTQPEKILGQFLDFLELESSAETSAFLSRLQDDTVGSYQAREQAFWFRDDHKVRMGRYKENLTMGELAEINSFLAPTLTKLGYPIQ